jgi:hypothetical protein
MGVKWKVASRGAGSTERHAENWLAECIQTASCEVVRNALLVQWQQCEHKASLLGYSIQWDSY